ncbi:DUF6233 domain-containing protein [Streptomyces sp. NPDC023588]|uniref:DUF6233 domain-containing protein n=1 Tax=Streptomyces sp. NPDC023588 TaxID=3154907 RepID=UPI0033E417D0
MKSSSASPEPVPVPIRVLLPGDQDVVGRLWSKRQVRDGWLCEVGLPAYRNGSGETMEPVEYRVWVRAPQHVQPLDGVSWRRPAAAGPARSTVHAVDCAEAPAGAPVLTLEHALHVAQHPATRLCSLCGAAAELDPVLKGFDRGSAATDARAAVGSPERVVVGARKAVGVPETRCGRKVCRWSMRR